MGEKEQAAAVPTIAHRLWRRIIVRMVGGFYEIGRVWFLIHDDGFSAGVDRVERVDWRWVDWRYR